MYVLFLRSLLRLRVALIVELKMKAVVTVIRWAMIFPMMMELMKESALKAIVQQKGFLKLAVKRYVYKKKCCIGSDWDGVNFLHSGPYGALFWMVTGTLLIAHQCAYSCWMVVHSTKICFVMWNYWYIWVCVTVLKLFEVIIWLPFVNTCHAFFLSP